MKQISSSVFQVGMDKAIGSLTAPLEQLKDEVWVKSFLFHSGLTKVKSRYYFPGVGGIKFVEFSGLTLFSDSAQTVEN